MIAAAAADVASHPAQEAEILKERDLAVTMVEGYMQWLEETGADAELRVLAAETKIQVTLTEGVDILTKLDARVEHVPTGRRLSLEHKTVGSLTEPLPLLQLDTQLLTEHLAEYLAAHEPADDESARAQLATGVLYNMLRRVKRTAAAKPPFYGREEVSHNINELRNHWRHVMSIARAIESARDDLDGGLSHHHVAPPSPDRSCSWQCEFFRVCPLFDDGSDVEAALEDLYVEGDPLERYVGIAEYEDEA